MKRLKLQNLKVQSFVTSMDKDEANTLKAGVRPTNKTKCGYDGCDTNGWCPTIKPYFRCIHTP